MSAAESGEPALGVLTIDKPEQLKALGHPLRLRVLELLTSPSATSDVHEAILHEVNAGWAKFGPQGKFRSAQATVRIPPERVRDLWDLLSERVDELEDPSQDPIVITLVFHPHTAS